jgi:hypothetical protein
MKYIILILSIFLASCATNGTGTIGNGVVDIDLGDGKLFGNEKAYVIGVTAAQIAVYNKPALGESMLSKLRKAKADVVEIEDTYTAIESARIVEEALRKHCGFYCNTVAGREYMNQYIVAAAEIADELGAGVEMRPSQFFDELIAQVEVVRATK